jgi:peptidyl-prolyl cis-trans isomerase D
MLQSLRDNMRGTLGAIVIGIIAVTLLLSFGVGVLAPSPTSGPEVASVNGEGITELELQRAILSRQNQLQQQFGDSLPESFISAEALREPVLDSLINREVLKQTAEDAGLAVSDQRVAQLLREVPDFQVNGRFDSNVYAQLVRRVGYTPIGYQQQVKEDLILSQMNSGFAATGFVTQKQLQETTRLSQQKRDFYYLTIPLTTVLSDIEVSEEQALAYYEKNKSNFQNPEQVSIEYIEILKSDIAEGIAITEQELQQQYQQELDAFDADAELHAAHILIESKDDGSHQQILTDIQTRLAEGEDFAVLAEELSEDFGTSGLGGDLGYTAGDTFPPEFEQALAALEVGAVSAPVETDAGFHIIKLLDKRGDVPPTFEEDKGRIERALKNSLAEEEYIARTQQLEELSYNATSLAEVAKSVDLEAKSAGPFSRSGGFGVASNPNVINEAFGDEVLVAGNTSPLIELQDGHVLVLRNTSHEPSRILSFEEVKAQVEESVKQELARERVAEIGADIEAEVAQGKSVEAAAKERGYEWNVSLDTQRTNPQVRRELLNYVFTLDKPEGDTVVRGLSSSNGDYFVLSLFKVADGDFEQLENAEKRNLRQRLASMSGESDFGAVAEFVQAKAKVER